MRALVVDDHGIARRGLVQLLEVTFGAVDCVTAGDGEQALAAARAAAPDIVLMDLDLPGHPQGHVLCSQLRAAAPAAVIVVVTAFERAGVIKQCLAGGAAGALLKETSDDDMEQSLRRLMDGELVVSPAIAERLATDFVGLLRGEEEMIRLTTREREVLDLLAAGCSNREIGERLVLSQGTIKDHVGALLRKLGATSRLQAVVRATEIGLL